MLQLAEFSVTAGNYVQENINSYVNLRVSAHGCQNYGQLQCHKTMLFCWQHNTRSKVNYVSSVFHSGHYHVLFGYVSDYYTSSKPFLILIRDYVESVRVIIICSVISMLAALLRKTTPIFIVHINLRLEGCTNCLCITPKSVSKCQPAGTYERETCSDSIPNIFYVNPNTFDIPQKQYGESQNVFRSHSVVLYSQQKGNKERILRYCQSKKNQVLEKSA